MTETEGIFMSECGFFCDFYIDICQVYKRQEAPND